MALADLTSPAAVTAALDEHDRVGREAFLKKYGFRDARTYFVLRDSRTYPSKAVAASAHGYQHGDPLTAGKFSGGDDTVAPRLRALGFQILRADREWMYEVGDVALRSDIHGTYGGAIYGGIESSARTPNVMIYTDPEQGTKNGYDYDGWDGNDPNVFYYTGEGRHGDQTMREGNKAIRDHESDGRALRLFEAVDEPQRPGGKRQRYVGEFNLDPGAPYRMAPAPDAAGDRRQVIVFRLVRAGATPATVRAAPPAQGPLAELPEPVPPSQPDEHRPEPATPGTDFVGDADVTVVDSEQNTVTEYELAPTTGRVAQRQEAQLVSQFEAWLRQRGGQPQRLRIKIPGERHELVTDTYDATAKMLYEAKAKSDRATVRLAVGQLLDYLRFTTEASGSILLPDEPTPDIKRLIQSVGFGLVYRKLGSWIIEPSGRDEI